MLTMRIKCRFLPAGVPDDSANVRGRGFGQMLTLLMLMAVAVALPACGQRDESVASDPGMASTAAPALSTPAPALSAEEVAIPEEQAPTPPITSWPAAPTPAPAAEALPQFAQPSDDGCKPWQHMEDDGSCADDSGVDHHRPDYEPEEGEQCWDECLCPEGLYPATDRCAPCSLTGIVCK
jgi:hypothetical protein